MADSWTVPLATGLFTDLNQQIAAGPPKLDFSDLKNAPDAYWKGQDQRYTQNQRDVFKDGLPKDASGNVDWGQVSQQLAKVGGAGAIDSIVKLGNYGIGRDAMDNYIKNGAGNVFSNPQGGPPSSATSVPNRPQSSLGQPQTTADVGGTPAPPGQNITGPGTTVTGVDYGPNTATNGTGGLTPRTLAARTGIDAETLAGGLGVSLDQALDQNDQMVRQKLASLVRPNTATDAGGSSAPLQPTPVQTQSFTPQNQPQPQAQPQQVAQNAAPQPAQMPQGQMTEQAAAQYESAGRRAAQASAAVAFANPASSAALKSLSDNYFKQATTIRDMLAKNAQTTPEQKNAAASNQPSPLGYQGQIEINKQDIDSYNKENVGLQEQGRAAYNGLQKAQLAKNLTLDPNFYSGPLNQYSQTYNQFKSIFGSNPASALPQEAFNKSINDMLQEQVRAMGKSGVGRVLQSEVNIMRNSIASLGITATSNRALLEIVQRVYKQQQDIAQISSSVPQQPGQMINTQNAKINQYLKQNPLFSEQEKQHPATLGAPDAPPQSAQWSPQQKQQWAHSIGAKSGDPIRFNGQIVSVP